MSNEFERTAEEQALIDAANVAPVSETPVETVIDTPTPNLDLPPVADAAPVATLRYEYQPTDEQGRPIGGKQVVVYTTSEELAQKLTEQNTLLIRKLREETRKNRLGIQDNQEIGTEAKRFEAPLELTPRTLTPEERYKIAREINDPDTFDQAADALLESRLGVKPEVLARTISDLQTDSLSRRAVAESEAFMADNQDFVRCPENGEAITSWLVRYNLAPVKENYQTAFDTLKKAGVLVLSTQPDPPPAAVVEPVVPVTPAAAAAPEPVAAAPARAAAPALIPTGLTRNQSTDVGTARTLGDDIIYEIPLPNGTKKRFVGAAALNAMPSDEYKHRLLHEAGFRDKAEKIEQAESAKRKFVRR